MCLVDPGNTIALSATPRDQNGQPMSSLGTASFSSSDAGVVAVTANGQVQAMAAGSAEVTASITSAGTTRTAMASIMVARTIAGDASGSVVGNHPLPHAVEITVAQLSAGKELSFNIQGQAFHSHTLGLTDTQVRLIAGGCPVSQLSSLDTHSNGTGLHSHEVKFN